VYTKRSRVPQTVVIGLKKLVRQRRPILHPALDCAKLALYAIHPTGVSVPNIHTKIAMCALPAAMARGIVAGANGGCIAILRSTRSQDVGTALVAFA